MTQQKIAQIALLVREYDDAIAFYVGCLDFDVLQDTDLGGGKRWVLVGPKGGGEGAALLLARATTPEQSAAVGNQGGGRVFLFLETDDFERDYSRMIACGVVFVEEPRRESYGTVAVFLDLYGNRWDLLQKAVP
ncbi:MAG: VOC family protein [Fibrella sp.]|nr:VOC family protein [Armatimonadota bacterium]